MENLGPPPPKRIGYDPVGKPQQQNPSPLRGLSALRVPCLAYIILSRLSGYTAQRGGHRERSEKQDVETDRQIPARINSGRWLRLSIPRQPLLHLAMRQSYATEASITCHAGLYSYIIKLCKTLQQNLALNTYKFV